MNIGDNPKEYEMEPIEVPNTEPVTVPEPELEPAK